MKKSPWIFCIIAAAAALMAFESADVVEADCSGKPQDAACSDYRAAGSIRAKNVIVLIGDGMGINQVLAARVRANGPQQPLAMETLPHRGQAVTCSLSGLTDSAAAATALATGHKAENKDISMSPDGKEYETLLELAAKQGKRTGLVTTTAISHATPAAFGAHDIKRSNQEAIAEDYIRQTRPEVLLGGGRDYFPPALLDEARKVGYAVATTEAELAALPPNTTARVLGLFADDELRFEAERKAQDEQPHLSRMAAYALDQLDEDPDGFFLMIEGGRIDHACHNGDIESAIGETLEFNRAAEAVLAWMQGRSDTLLVITADHETGGVKVLGGDYKQGDTVKAQFTTKVVPGLSAMHSTQRVPIYAEGPNAAAVQPVMDNTGVYCLLRNALSGGK